MAYIIPQRAVGFASQRCFMLTLCCCHTIQAKPHKAEIWPSFPLWQKRQKEKLLSVLLWWSVLGLPDLSGTWGKWPSHVDIKLEHIWFQFIYFFLMFFFSALFPIAPQPVTCVRTFPERVQVLPFPTNYMYSEVNCLIQYFGSSHLYNNS